jgi:hypothetical protein
MELQATSMTCRVDVVEQGGRDDKRRQVPSVAGSVTLSLPIFRKDTHLYAFAFLKNSYASPKDNAPTTLIYT